MIDILYTVFWVCVGACLGVGICIWLTGNIGPRF